MKETKLEWYEMGFIAQKIKQYIKRKSDVKIQIEYENKCREIENENKWCKSIQLDTLIETLQLKNISNIHNVKINKNIMNNGMSNTTDNDNDIMNMSNTMSMIWNSDLYNEIYNKYYRNKNIEDKLNKVDVTINDKVYPFNICKKMIGSFNKISIKTNGVELEYDGYIIVIFESRTKWYYVNSYWK